jgi:FkbH-like protein
MREAIEAATRAGDVAGALEALRALVASDRSRRTLAFMERTLDEIDTAKVLRPLSVHVLRSITLDPLAAYVRAHGLAHGLDVRLRFGEYNQFEQELAGRGALGTEAPDAVIFAARLEELAPDLAYRFIGTGERRAEVQQAIAERMRGWLDAAERRWPRALRILWNFAQPTHAAYGIAEPHVQGQRAAIRDLNRALATACRDRPSSTLFDLDGVVSDVGRIRAYDARNMASARLPFSSDALDALGRATARVLAAAFVKRRKCVVLDCDNTLWGGVIGEDGIDNIALGPDHPGSAYVAFQRAILNLVDRGIIVALASKNNEADVMRVLREHPFQQLREVHLAAWRLNWNDKATSLRELAAELNLGLDSFVFIDDSDFECGWVREQLPEVLVVQAPADPLALQALVDDLDVFDALALSSEDLARGQMYKAETARTRAREGSQSVEDFLESLQMRLSIRSATEGQVVRIAQLTQKTNQFNLTTRRYSEADIRQFLAAADTDVFQIHLADRFGEYGLIGVLITRLSQGRLGVDTLLLSCRVLGRKVEHALFAFLLRHAAGRGARSVVGEYIPTAKNAQTAELYPQFGFKRAEGTGGPARFERPTADPPPFPACFTLDLALEDLT